MAFTAEATASGELRLLVAQIKAHSQGLTASGDADAATVSESGGDWSEEEWRDAFRQLVRERVVVHHFIFRVDVVFHRKVAPRSVVSFTPTEYVPPVAS